MKTLFKTITLAITCLLLVLSCSKDSLDIPDAIESTNLVLNRAVFEDWDDLEKTRNEIEESNSDDFIMNWVFEKGHSSLYIQSIDDEEVLNDLENLSTSMIAVLNKDYEFQVGNEIISYEDKVFYSQSISSDNKEKSTIRKKIGTSEAYYIPIGENDTKNFDAIEKSTDIWSDGGVSALVDKEFDKFSYVDCASSYTSGSSSRRWKYRQMLKAVREGQNIKLYVECKLYINKSTGSNSFRYAESKRNYTYNFSGNAIIGNQGFNFNFSNVPRDCIGGSSTKNRFNRLFLAGRTNINNVIISVTGSGTITHELNGNRSSERWVNNFNW